MESPALFHVSDLDTARGSLGENHASAQFNDPILGKIGMQRETYAPFDVPILESLGEKVITFTFFSLRELLVLVL